MSTHASASRRRQHAQVRFLCLLEACVDRPVKDPYPPAANYIPNSNGEGGRVIASGHP